MTNVMKSKPQDLQCRRFVQCFGIFIKPTSHTLKLASFIEDLVGKCLLFTHLQTP